MANRLYFDDYMDNKFDEKALVQDYKGFVLKRVAGHVYVVRTFLGFYKLKSSKKALSFRWPFSQAKLVKNVETSDVINFTDPILTHDDVNVTAGGPITFQFEVIDDKIYYEKVYEHTDLKQNLNDRVKEIIRFIVNRGELDDVKKQFSITSTVNGVEYPDWITGDDVLTLDQMFRDIETKYGIKVKRILSVDFNEPQIVQDARTEFEAAKLKQETAKVEREIKRQDYELERENKEKNVQIDVDKLRKSIETLYSFARTNGYTQEQTTKLVGYILSPNATHIDMANNPVIDRVIAKLDALSDNAPAQVQQAPIQAQQAPVQAQQASAQAQQAPAQAQQAPVQAQQAPVQAQQSPIQTQPVKDATPKKAVKAVRVYAKRGNAKTDKKNGVKGNVPTPRKHSHNQQSNGHGMTRR